MKYLSLFGAFLAVIGLALEPSFSQQTQRSGQRTYQPKVGEPHVDFVLPQIKDRKPLSLSSLRGKKVLLLHFASW